MWVTSVLVENDQVMDAELLQSYTLHVSTDHGYSRQALLVHILADEGRNHLDRLCAITCFAITVDHAQRQGGVTVHQPVVELTLAEQATLRRWLIRQRWPAWARADQTLRTMLGVPDPPILLAEAARAWMIPLPTLAKAAQTERLPTMHVGDRHLVYSTSIREAQERHLLHDVPGRPKRRS